MPDSAAESQKTATCANCGAPWGAGRTSFCGECGYSARLGRDGNNQAAEQPAASSQFGIVILFVGVLTIPVAAVMARCSIWESGDHLVWMYWIAGIGGGMALFGHVLGWCVCVTQSSMGLSDIVFSPLRIWGTVFHSLPQGIAPLCLFGFGMMTAISGGLCFGIDYESVVRSRPYETREQLTDLVEAIQNITPRLGSLAADTESVDDAVAADDAPESQEDGTGAGETSPVSIDVRDRSSATQHTAECLVIGLVENADGELLSLVLAVPGRETIRYAGTVPIGDIEPQAFTDIVEHSLSLRLDRLLIECPVEAIGLQPDAVCNVEFDGWSEKHEMIAPRVMEITQHLSDARSAGP